MRFLKGIFALFEGMKMVAIHLFRPTVTVKYPEKRDKFSSRLRGCLAINVDKNGKIDCVGCRSCIRVCPCIDAIKIESERIDGSVIINKFEIDSGKCILCGNCVFVCPKGVLKMTPEYEMADSDKTVFIRGIDEMSRFEEEEG